MVKGPTAPWVPFPEAPTRTDSYKESPEIAGRLRPEPTSPAQWLSGRPALSLWLPDGPVSVDTDSLKARHPQTDFFILRILSRDTRPLPALNGRGPVGVLTDLRSRALQPLLPTDTFPVPQARHSASSSFSVLRPPLPHLPAPDLSSALGPALLSGPSVQAFGSRLETVTSILTSVLPVQVMEQPPQRCPAPSSAHFLKHCSDHIAPLRASSGEQVWREPLGLLGLTSGPALLLPLPSRSRIPELLTGPACSARPTTGPGSGSLVPGILPTGLPVSFLLSTSAG